MALCMGCMNEIGNGNLCPDCGFNNNKSQSAPFLPFNTTIMNRYVVGNKIESNGESTRYIGFDTKTNNKVIIREYLPIGLFTRATGKTDLIVNLDSSENFERIKNDFIFYFRTLKKLRELSAMMQVYTVFEENNTVYTIEQYEDLIPFNEYIKRSNGQIEWDIARPLFMPLISVIEALHKNGVGHYAVSPRNIYMSSEGKAKLYGFSTEHVRKNGTALKAELFNGCAAPEQYNNNDTLDPSTDIYGFSATLFFALTGNLPAVATERVKDSRLLMSTNTVKRLPPHVVTALANGLNVERDVRISDFEDLRSQLSAAPTVQAIQEEISRTSSMTPIAEDKDKYKTTTPSRTVFIISLVVSLIVLSVAGYFFYLQNPFKGIFGDSKQTVETTSPDEEKWTGPIVEDYLGENFEEIDKKTSGGNDIKLYRAYEDENSDTYNEGQISSQYPPAGTPIKNEGTVAIYVTVSKGPLMRELPKIENLTVSDAANKLNDLGFLVERVNEYNPNFSEERVVSYKDYQPGEKLEQGSLIKIRVSLGKEETED